MKKLLCLLLALMLLTPAALCQSMQERVQKDAAQQVLGAWVKSWPRYENTVYRYSFCLPQTWAMQDEKERQAALDEIAAQDGEHDRLAEMRQWYSEDYSLVFCFQIKEPTYDSLQTECDKYGEYLSSVIADAQEGYGHYAYVRDTPLVHSTPIGDMLEMPITYDYTYPDGRVLTFTRVYYDYYYAGLEYIFLIEAAGENYETAAWHLEQIVNSAAIGKLLED